MGLTFALRVKGLLYWSNSNQLAGSLIMQPHTAAWICEVLHLYFFWSHPSQHILSSPNHLPPHVFCICVFLFFTQVKIYLGYRHQLVHPVQTFYHDLTLTLPAFGTYFKSSARSSLRHCENTEKVLVFKLRL